MFLLILRSTRRPMAAGFPIGYCCNGEIKEMFLHIPVNNLFSPQFIAPPQARWFFLQAYRTTDQWEGTTTFGKTPCFQCNSPFTAKG